jgi:hypothetical protein
MCVDWVNVVQDGANWRVLLNNDFLFHKKRKTLRDERLSASKKDRDPWSLLRSRGMELTDEYQALCLPLMKIAVILRFRFSRRLI